MAIPVFVQEALEKVSAGLVPHEEVQRAIAEMARS
jgi:hypothetical protein